MFTALRTLAIAALILDVVWAMMFTWGLGQTFSIGYGPGGVEGSIPTYVAGELSQIAGIFSSALSGGVIVLGMVLAWAERRKVWLVALFVVALLTLPMGVWQGLWVIFGPHAAPPLLTGGVGQPPPLQVIGSLLLSAGVAPVILALIFALPQSRGGQSAVADTELELSREPL